MIPLEHLKVYLLDLYFKAADTLTYIFADDGRRHDGDYDKL